MKCNARKFAFYFAVQLVDIVGDGVENRLGENIVRTPPYKPLKMIILF